MKRSKFPAVISNEVNDGVFRDFMQSMPKADKIKLYGIQEKVQEGLFNLKRETYLIGEQLFKAKWLLKHGMFIPWIKETFNDDLPYGTAYLYMRIYEVFKDSPDTVRMIPTHCLANFTQKDFPVEVINILKENNDKLNKSGLKEVSNAYGLVKRGTIDNDQFLKIAKKEINQSMKIVAHRTKHRINRNMRDPVYEGITYLVSNIKGWRENAEKMGWLHPFDPDSEKHHKVNELLDEAIKELSELKTSLNGGDGLFKPTSTKEGDVMMPNL